MFYKFHILFQLIIALEFNQKVKLHSLKIDAPAGNTDKTWSLSKYVRVYNMYSELPLVFTPSQIVHMFSDKGPKTVKLFINQPNTLDFDKAESREPVQTIV